MEMERIKYMLIDKLSLDEDIWKPFKVFIKKKEM